MTPARQRHNDSIPDTTEQHDFALGSGSGSGSDDGKSIDSHVHNGDLDGDAGQNDISLLRGDEPPYSNGRRLSFIDQDDTEAQPEIPKAAKAEVVGWMDLPHKRQLAILTLARLSEPLTQTSIQVRAPVGEYRR